MNEQTATVAGVYPLGGDMAIALVQHFDGYGFVPTNARNGLTDGDKIAWHLAVNRVKTMESASQILGRYMPIEAPHLPTTQSP